MVIAFIMLCFSSCKTAKVVPIKSDSVRIEYRDRDVFRTDSIYIREKDSVYIEKSGDSVREFRGKETVLWREKEVHDTVKVETEKVVEKEIPVTVEVEKKLGWYDKIALKAGKWLLPLLCLLILFLAIYLAVKGKIKK